MCGLRVSNKAGYPGVATTACPQILIQILSATIYHTVRGIFKRDVLSQKIHTSI